MSDQNLPEELERASEGEKLQKILARAGLGSRRELERWISEGRVSVDGRKASLGDRAEPHQVIRVDGRIIQDARRAPKRRILLYHKPEGEVCTRSDPEGRITVFDHLPKLRQGRWVSVGRLDLNTAGLLLFTNDGELANGLMHPRRQIVREYAVRVFGEVGPAMLKRLNKGVRLEDGPARFDSVVDAGGEGANHWYRVTLKEGRHREVRRMWEAVGVTVSRLSRIRFGPVELPRSLRTGRWQEPDATTTKAILEAAGIHEPAQAGAAKRRPTGRGKASPKKKPGKRRYLRRSGRG